jgi:hypothetical protein
VISHELGKDWKVFTSETYPWSFVTQIFHNGQPNQVFQQTIDIPSGTNCAPLLANLFLWDYETDFIQGLLKNKDRKLDQTFNSSFRYIDDVLSPNSSRFSDYLHRIYPN